MDSNQITRILAWLNVHSAPKLRFEVRLYSDGPLTHKLVIYANNGRSPFFCFATDAEGLKREFIREVLDCLRGDEELYSDVKKELGL